MGAITRNPTANSSPDPGQGGTTAVTGNINTGHGSTVSAGGNGTSQSKSCVWQSWLSVGGSKAEVTLKFEYTAEATLQAASTGPGDFGQADAIFTIQYSLDGGANWLPAVSHSAQAFSGAGSPPVDNDGFSFPSGTFSVALPVNQDLTLVRVRDRGDAITSINGAATASASHTFSVSNIRIEANVLAQSAACVIM